MAITTRGGKQTIDLHISSKVKIIVGKNDDDEIRLLEILKNATEKEEEVTQKVNHMPRPPPYCHKY